MKIEVWSDVVCPFCYIGKRKMERALLQFAQNELVEIEWKSFQLIPDLETNISINSLENLAKSKGWTMQQAREITAQVSEIAKKEGLKFDFENSVVANTRNAHRLIHLAKSLHKGNEMKERLLKAYFSDSSNIDDPETLFSLGQEIGIAASTLKTVLDSNLYQDAVDHDILEAKLIGIKGVPFFLIDQKFAISGAQSDEVFKDTLDKAWSHFIQKNGYQQTNDRQDSSACAGESC